jgi:hypothetical protein
MAHINLDLLRSQKFITKRKVTKESNIPWYRNLKNLQNGPQKSYEII